MIKKGLDQEETQNCPSTNNIIYIFASLIVEYMMTYTRHFLQSYMRNNLVISFKNFIFPTNSDFTDSIDMIQHIFDDHISIPIPILTTVAYYCTCTI